MNLELPYISITNAVMSWSDRSCWCSCTRPQSCSDTVTSVWVWEERTTTVHRRPDCQALFLHCAVFPLLPCQFPAGVQDQVAIPRTCWDQTAPSTLFKLRSFAAWAQSTWSMRRWEQAKRKFDKQVQTSRCFFLGICRQGNLACSSWHRSI